MERDWVPDRSPELREQARREIARLRGLRRQLNRALSCQRARQLGENRQVGIKLNPLKPTLPQR
jgi:hypothetical protein